MPGGIVTAQMPAPAAEVFALLHDYDRRLEWDTLLKEARLTQGHTRAQKGATSLCVGKPLFGLIGMETRYIAFREPDMAAVVLINRPPFFDAFSASIKHRDNAHGSTAEYTFQFRARPACLRRLLERVMLRALKRETAKRLRALSDHLEKQAAQNEAGNKHGAGPGSSA
ncbi:MAG: SRPBCC family protein [Planctomycetota bacterium]